MVVVELDGTADLQRNRCTAVKIIYLFNIEISYWRIGCTCVCRERWTATETAAGVCCMIQEMPLRGDWAVQICVCVLSCV